MVKENNAEIIKVKGNTGERMFLHTLPPRPAGWCGMDAFHNIHRTGRGRWQPGFKHTVASRFIQIHIQHAYRLLCRCFRLVYLGTHGFPTGGHQPGLFRFGSPPCRDTLGHGIIGHAEKQTEILPSPTGKDASSTALPFKREIGIIHPLLIDDPGDKPESEGRMNAITSPMPETLQPYPETW